MARHPHIHSATQLLLRPDEKQGLRDRLAVVEMTALLLQRLQLPLLKLKLSRLHNLQDEVQYL